MGPPQEEHRLSIKSRAECDKSEVYCGAGPLWAGGLKERIVSGDLSLQIEFLRWRV